jgi:hypothetical protein
MVTGEMASLRKSLDEDFDRQRKSLLAAFNEELSRALRSSDRESSGQKVAREENAIDLRSELDRHRRQLDEELKRHLSGKENACSQHYDIVY